MSTATYAVGREKVREYAYAVGETDPLHPVSTAQRLHELLPESSLHVSATVADVQTWTNRITDFLAA